MQGKYKFERLLKYPHFRPEETAIWERFIIKFPNYFESVDYDLKVGTPREYPEGYPFGLSEAMRELSKKRIDVVGYSGKKVYIVEVEPNAGHPGIGQVLSVTELYKREHPDVEKVVPVLITDRENPDIRELCRKFGIVFFVV